MKAPRRITHSSFGGHRLLPRPRVRNILLAINLLILVLPLAGILALRIYESALIRQTESELIAQGAFVSAVYTSLLADTSRKDAAGLPPNYGIPLAWQAPVKPPDADPAWRPRNPQLDLADDPLLPAPAAAQAVDGTADRLAIAAGQALTPILNSAQVYTLAGIRVVDFRGIVVASTGDGADIGRSLIAREEVASALRGEPRSLMRRRDAEAGGGDALSRGARLRVVVATPITDGGRVFGAVLLARTPGTLWQAVKGKARPLIWSAVLLFVAVLGLSLFMSRMISHPVHALIGQARRAARGERGAVIPLRHAGTREIAELSETVAAMAQALEQRATYIRDFAANVSHEFKTPLTAIQGSIELLREHGEGMSAMEHERFLAIVEDDVQRLSRLVRRLLDLARADMQRPGGGCALLRAGVDACAARYRGLGLAVEVEHRCPEQAVAMAPEILESILGNLLDNARQHGGDKVKVLLATAQEQVDEMPCARIDVVDDGPGISTGNADKIFDPFFTTAREQGGTGLGLSIVRSLLAAHGGAIAMLSVSGAGFRIRIPLAAGERPGGPGSMPA